MKETESAAALGALVAKQRLTLGYSQKGFAVMAGIDVKTLRSLENGERWPHDVQRLKIETALGWRQGAMAEIRDNEDADATLANLRPNNTHGDEQWPESERAAKRAANLTDAELLSELTYRFNQYARARHQPVEGTAEQDGYGLAAMSGPNRGRELRVEADTAGEESQEPVDDDPHQQ